MKNFVTIAFVLCGIVAHTQTTENPIRINQLGYYENAPKIVIVTGNPGTNSFYLVSVSKKDTVFKGQLSAVMQSSNSSLQTRVADFTTINATGVYTIAIPGVPS